MGDSTSQLGRVAATAGVAFAFVVMLTGTSKEPQDQTDTDKGAEAEAAARQAAEGESAPEPTPELTPEVPSTEGWTKVEIPGAGVSLALPEGAKVLADLSGNDPSFTGRYFTLELAGGYELYLAQNNGQPVDLAGKKTWYERDAIGFEGLVFEADDALVAARNESGMVDEGGKVSTLDHAEVMQLVALARSVEALE